MTDKQRDNRRLIRFVCRLALVIGILGALILADQAGLFGREALDDRQKYEDATFRVTRVVDGDTLNIAIPDGGRRTTRVRLWGVDTPETVHPNESPEHFGHEATALTTHLADNQNVTIRLEPTGRTRDNAEYNRLLAYVILPDGRMLNRVLIATGHGDADPRYDHQFKADFAAAQAEAREQRLGLWRNVTNADLPFYYTDKLQLPPPLDAPTNQPPAE